MSELVIRPARPEDITQLHALAREVITKCYTPFLGQKMVDRYIDSGAADAEITKHYEHLSLAEHADQIVGLAVCFDDLVHLLMTRLDQQRCGVGTSLLRWCEAQIVSRGHQSARLETFSDNAQARQFYFKNGWKEVGKTSESGVPMVYFEKSL